MRASRPTPAQGRFSAAWVRLLRIIFRTKPTLETLSAPATLSTTLSITPPPHPRGTTTPADRGVIHKPKEPTTVSPAVIRGRFVGAHYWHWTAPVATPGRDLLLEKRKELAGTLVWWESRELEGQRITLERHIPKRSARGPGSVVLRYDLRATEGETPEDHMERSAAFAKRVFEELGRSRGMGFAIARLSQKPHWTIRGDSVAQRVGRTMRVTTTDAYGKVWIDFSAHAGGGPWERGDREANTPESTAAYLRLDGNLQATLEELRGVRADLKALPEVVGALKELAGEIRGVRGPEGPARPAPPGPEIG